MINVAVIDERAHKAIEESQKQNTNVVTINISIGHDDDLVITDLGDIEVLADAGADRGDHVADFGVLEDAVFPRLFNVQNLATERQDRLGLHGHGRSWRSHRRNYPRRCKVRISRDLC
jgi:hypothetical protein